MKTILLFMLVVAMMPLAPGASDDAVSNASGSVLTTGQGHPIFDNNNSLTVGERGPTLLQDIEFIEKIANFDRERIPERVVHAKGAGAFGYFQVYEPMTNYTKAKFLQDPDQKTPVFVRFSTVAGGRGSADTVRDVRGFATKFYTEEGNYDIVGNDLPVFFIRDAIKFPDLVHAVKAEPHNNIPSSSTGHNNFWDFISQTPESTHMLTWVFSDRGTPASYRMMEGFGVNTYVWVNSEGQAVYVKYHWKPALGVKNFDHQNAYRIAGEDPDYLVRDLWDAIERGESVEYELYVQMMNISEELNQTFDPLDDTKTWPEDQFPLMPVGKMVLDRNPDNFFTQVEQAAFCPANLVPGIELSADKMLQGRVFSYADTQRYRLGVNFKDLPTNRSLATVANNQRDGAMQTKIFNGSINFAPSSQGGLISATEAGVPYEPYVQGNITRETIYKTDDFSQARERYLAMNETEKEHLAGNLVADLKWVTKPEIQRLAIDNIIAQIDEGLAATISEALGL
ncbi:catalase [Methanothrix sp.]|uniref:catalase n=1 Tax=Methanothrix sp. TaxID=90426 RepID=UPI003BB60E8D